MSSRAAIYCRISSDPSGRGAGVARQQDDCTTLAATKGWDVTHTLIDNDVSAYSGKPRPGYRRLMDAVRSGAVDVIVAWHPDRLHRSPLELEDFITAVEQAGVTVETVQSGRYDLSTPSGRFMARNIGAAARYESEHKSERVQRALAERARHGASHGRPSYGWTRQYALDGSFVEVENPEQAAVVREITERLVAGESIRSVTTDLNRRAVPPPTGEDWTKGKVRRLALRESNAGRRVHQGRVIGEGAWPALVPESTFERLVANLNDPRRRTSQSSAAVHLLSGIAKCGVCGAVMRVGNNKVPSYRCSASYCVSRQVTDVDDLVVDVVLARLARPDAAQLLSADSGDSLESAAEAEHLRRRLDAAADDYADGKIEARQLQRITERLRPAIAAAEQRMHRVDDSDVLDGLAGNERAEEVWETLDLQRRRAVINALVSVTVLRTQPGRRSFDPESVLITRRTPLADS